ncbi:MAG: RIP metalloprotease RseP [Candidatus Cyclobacteriaceae bacterium M2_1C_046]
MEGLIMTAQILLSLSILVGLHEMGHLLAAKYFGMRVEQFSIGFPPRIFTFKIGETEYSLSAIPLGGYVKISGMIDESLDTEKMKEEPKDYEFRAKPAWQRLIVMLGGIFVNIITGIVIFIILTFTFGDAYLSNQQINESGGIVAYDLAQEIGLQTGDKIIAVNGQEFDDFQKVINPDVLLSDNAYYTVLRDGEKVRVDIPANFIEKLQDREAVGNFIVPRLPVKVTQVNDNSIADQMGIQEGDRIVRIDGNEINTPVDVPPTIQNFQGDTISVTVQRNGNLINYKAPFESGSLLGIGVNFPEDIYSTVDYGLGESIAKGTERAFAIVFLQVKAFGKMFSGELSVTKSLSGPIGIAQAYGGTWDWHNFWRLTGLLSMVLAFMNLLPIPALDGGHVMFLTYEMISGSKPSDKFLENAQKVGMVFLLALMVFIIFNDIIKLF